VLALYFYCLFTRPVIKSKILSRPAANLNSEYKNLHRTRRIWLPIL